MRFVRVPVRPLAVIAVVGGLTAAVRYEVGPSIGYFLVTFLWATLLAATATTGTRSLARLTKRAAVVWAGTTLVWSYDVHLGFLTASQWFAAVLLLASTVVAVVSTVAALERWYIPAPLPTAAVVATFLVWYAMPIYGSVLLDRNWVVRCQPALTLNGTLSDLGVWTEQPVAYQMTGLGQDVFYTLPASVDISAVTHLLWASVFILSVIARQLWSSSRRRASRRETEVVLEPSSRMPDS